MADDSYQIFADYLNKVKLPAGTAQRTEESFERYEYATDIVLMYRGHPDVLWSAMEAFIATEYLPYIYAGTANVMRSASYLSGGKHASKGVRAAIQMFESAKSLNPYAFEILILEPLLHGSLDDKKAMRYQLDQLAKSEEAATNFRYASTEMSYWKLVGDISRVVQWHDRAMKVATTDIQRLSALNSLAGMFLNQDKMKEAIALYQKVVEIDPNDAWAWHNMAYMYFRMNEYSRAGVCNERALSIMEFGAAQGIRADLIKRWSASRHADVLDDVPPYNVTSTGRTDVAAMFKRFFNS